jgi:hypothetical protein
MHQRMMSRMFVRQPTLLALRSSAPDAPAVLYLPSNGHVACEDSQRGSLPHDSQWPRLDWDAAHPRNPGQVTRGTSQAGLAFDM